MPIDSSIALGVKPIELQNPVNSMSQLLQAQGLQQSNQLNQLKLQQQQTASDRQNKLYSLMAGLPADVSDDQRSAALKGAGFFDQADTLDKNIIERNKAKAEAQAKQAEVLTKYVGAHRALTGQVFANPTVENAIAAIQKSAQYHKMLGLGENDVSDDIAQVSQMNPEQIKRWAAGHALEADNLKPVLKDFAAGDYHYNQAIDPITGLPTQTGRTVIGQSADNKATTSLGYAELGEKKRHNAATEADGKTQVVVDPTRGPLIVNKVSGKTIGATDAQGNPIQGEVPAKREANAKNLLSILDEADGLIGQATGSYVGAGVDQAARLVGAATGGDKASARLKVLEGTLMMNQPRMEGPQSDKDVALYKQMAGQIGDSTVPASIKKEAMKTIRGITEKYAGVAPSTPAKNSKGWTLHTDASGNRAYVSPDGKSFEEVK